MARVELYPPYTKILLWTWTELPHVFRVGSALPNMIMERHVVGCNPLQLRAAFEHLRALVSIVVANAVVSILCLINIVRAA